MDLDLFGAFEGTAAPSTDPGETAEEIQYVPKAKRQKREGGTNLFVSSARSDATAVVDPGSATLPPAMEIPDDLPVFTDELVTKTDTGNTLKQVCVVHINYNQL